MIIPGNGLPLLSDFGECRFLDQVNSADIMPNAYRGPEVILKMDWDLKVDIWNVALLVSQPDYLQSLPTWNLIRAVLYQAWDIVSTRRLFQGVNADDIFDDRTGCALRR